MKTWFFVDLIGAIPLYILFTPILGRQVTYSMNQLLLILKINQIRVSDPNYIQLISSKNNQFIFYGRDNYVSSSTIVIFITFYIIRILKIVKLNLLFKKTEELI